jgi:hypothetical protein
LPVLRAFAPLGEEARVEACLHDIVVCCLRHAAGHLVFLDKNNKSGSAFTIFVNMILQGVIIEYTRLKQGRLGGLKYILCGDDNLLCCEDDELDPFEFYPDFGVVLKFVHEARSPAELEFMSKGFKKTFRGWVPLVNVDKHICSLKYEPDWDAGLFVQKCNSLILESAHSPGVERLVDIRRRALPSLYRPGSCSSYNREQALSSWWSLEECREFHFSQAERQKAKQKSEN